MLAQPYGDRGILLSNLGDEPRAAYIASLEKALPPDCVEYVAGYDSILLVGDVSALKDSFKSLSSSLPKAEAKKPKTVEIPVHYAGADLEEVAEAVGATVREVIDWHSAPTYTVRMMGFSPGFPYLDGLDKRLHMERRASPRDRIEPGSVAIGGPHAGVYTIASPGGWHILGKTDLTLFNPEKAQGEIASPRDVFTLAVGDQVKFQPI